MANSHFENSRVLDPLVMTALSAGDAAAVIEHKEWLKAAGCSHNTINDRVRLLVRLNAWLLNQPTPKTLGSATSDDLATWQRSISKLATETIATYVGHARGYYRWRAKYKHDTDASALLVRPRVPRRLPRPINDISLRDALHMADGVVSISLMLMAFCGLRVGEVARLQRHDICDHDTPPIVVIHNSKGGKYRTVPMPHDLGPELRRVGVPLRGPVVVAASGDPYTPGRLSQVVNEFLHDHGIADTAHALRHWYGTNAYRLTGDIRLVQELLGHSSPVTTAGYAAYDPRQADVVAAAIDGRMADMLPGVGHRRRLWSVPSS